MSDGYLFATIVVVLYFVFCVFDRILKARGR